LSRTEDIRRYGEAVQFHVPDPIVFRNELSVSPYLTEEQLIQLKNWFIFVNGIKKRFFGHYLSNYFNRLHDYNEIIADIDVKIDNSAQIRDNASALLQRIRDEKKKIKINMQAILQRLLMDRPSLFTDSTILQRNGRYVLPVRRNFKKDLHGVVHSYSNSGETVFIEPMEITDDSARLVEIEEQEREEVQRILKELTKGIRSRIDEIEQDIEVIVDLDLLFAKARFADNLNATRPIFGQRLKIVNGYHPLLKRVKENVEPLNLSLNSDKKVLLISGPNAGGKTVVLKTVGLIIQMAECGMFIPAEEGSVIPFFDEVYADIGDEQSIETNLSTFAAHVKQIKEALEGDDNSLVLLDELMSQTSVEEGSALATAILEAFVRKKGMVLATTHNEDLKIYVSRREDMINGGMEFSDKPTYRLIIGIPQPSNAIKLANNLGLNGGIIQNALKYLDKDKMSLNKLFEDLSKELKAVEIERGKLSILVKDYETKLKELNEKKKRELSELKAKYKNELIQAKRSIEKLVKDLKNRGPKPEAIHEMRSFFEKKLQIEDIHMPYHPRVGEMVRIRELRKVGLVIAEHAGRYKISLENIFYWVDPKEIERIVEE